MSALLFCLYYVMWFAYNLPQFLSTVGTFMVIMYGSRRLMKWLRTL